MTNTPKNLNVSLYKDDQLQNTKSCWIRSCIDHCEMEEKTPKQILTDVKECFESILGDFFIELEGLHLMTKGQLF